MTRRQYFAAFEAYAKRQRIESGDLETRDVTIEGEMRALQRKLRGK